jgi:hypothetical protein
MNRHEPVHHARFFRQRNHMVEHGLRVFAGAGVDQDEVVIPQVYWGRFWK